MSTDYRSLSPIYISDLLDGRMENVRLTECPGFDGPLKECLTDGRSNFLWVYFDAEGLVESFTSYGENGDPSGILREISEILDVEIVCEHQPQFYGCETWEEVNASLEKWEVEREREREKREVEREKRERERERAREKRDRKFYEDAIRFIRGESNTIQRGTIEMEQAEIAKCLVTDSPDLLAPHRWLELIELIRARYYDEIPF